MNSKNENDLYTRKTTEFEGGIGLFGIKDLYEHIQLNYGCRFLYIYDDYKYTSSDPMFYGNSLLSHIFQTRENCLHSTC